MTRQRAVALIVVLVGLYDGCSGLFMLLSRSPQLVHGTSTLWAVAPEGASPQMRVVLASLFARMGALSLHTGVVSIVWCATAWRNRRAMSVLLLSYLATGLVFFFATDLRYFGGTPYFAVKQTLGGLWMFAVVLHFWPPAKQI